MQPEQTAILNQEVFAIARIMAEFPDKGQLSFAIDSLRNYGLDREDMVVSDGIDANDSIYLKNETDDLKGTDFAESGQLTIAVEAPENNRDRIAAILEESGAERVWWG